MIWGLDMINVKDQVAVSCGPLGGRVGCVVRRVSSTHVIVRFVGDVYDPHGKAKNSDVPMHINELIVLVEPDHSQPMAVGQDPALLSKKQAMAVARVKSFKTLTRWIEDGEFPAPIIHRKGGTVLFCAEHVRLWQRGEWTAEPREGN